jgi:hypothetical protein
MPKGSPRKTSAKPAKKVPEKKRKLAESSDSESTKEKVNDRV